MSWVRARESGLFILSPSHCARRQDNWCHHKVFFHFASDWGQTVSDKGCQNFFGLSLHTENIWPKSHWDQGFEKNMNSRNNSCMVSVSVSTRWGSVYLNGSFVSQFVYLVSHTHNYLRFSRHRYDSAVRGLQTSHVAATQTSTTANTKWNILPTSY